MNKFTVGLFLHFCLPLLLCEASEGVCTVEDLPSLLDQPGSTSTNSFNTIIISYSFGCCGQVSAWGALINQTQRRIILNFQVWRPQNEASCQYKLIRSINFTSSQLTEQNNFTVAVTAQERIGFQTNDVIGISVQNTTKTGDSVRLRRTNNLTLKGVLLNKEGMGSSRQQGRCVNLNASRIKEVPIITAIIEPTPCPSTPIQSPPITTAPHTTPGNTNSQPTGLGGGAVAGIIITVLVVVLLCAVIVVVSLVLIFARKSKRKRPRQKTFGKARFIRSVYIIPTLYKAKKDGKIKNDESTEQTSTSSNEKAEGEGQGTGKEEEQEASNSDLYVNQQEFTRSSDPLTPSDKVTNDDDLYENNPLARRYFRDKEKEQQRDLDNDKGLYVNRKVFTQTPTLDTPSDKAQPPTLDTPSDNKFEGNDDELYVNNLRVRQKLKDLPLYENQRMDISTTTNKAYGVTERSEALNIILQQQQEQEQCENGEDEYVDVDVNKDSPEEEYENMAMFRAQKFTKK